MYSACLFCNQRLGSNRAIPSFPVGTCLAYDVRKGRLWVVCPHCERWNLTAADERSEAIEDCERLFRKTHLRISGENISLAHLPDGLELIRIGKPLRMEVAAWRYGRRATRARADDAAEPAVAGGRGWDVGGAIRSLVSLHRRDLEAGAAVWFRLHAQPQRVIASVASEGEDRALICYRHVESAELIRPETGQPLRLSIEHDRGRVELAGRAALGTLGRLLAVINGRRAPEDAVRAALRKLDHAGDPQSYFSRIATLALRTSWGRDPDATSRAPLLLSGAGPAERLTCYLACRSFWARGGTTSAGRTSLLRLSAVDRLALEMATHEEAERQALQGELAGLEAAWREAEEIAAIADQLFRAGEPGPRRRAPWLPFGGGVPLPQPAR